MSGNGEFAADCLNAINGYRKKHQVEPLTMNSEICRISQDWVDQLARTNSFGHNTDATYRGDDLGENCAMNYRSDGAEFTGVTITVDHNF